MIQDMHVTGRQTKPTSVFFIVHFQCFGESTDPPIILLTLQVKPIRHGSTLPGLPFMASSQTIVPPIKLIRFTLESNL